MSVTEHICISCEDTDQNKKHSITLAVLARKAQQTRSIRNQYGGVKWDFLYDMLSKIICVKQASSLETAGLSKII
jgi:hypothetical protein